MHPSHLTAFVDGFLTIGIPMQAKGATTREILIAMSERNMGSVGADAILCRVRGCRDLRGEVLDIGALVSEMIDAAGTGIAPAWAA